MKSELSINLIRKQHQAIVLFLSLLLFDVPTWFLATTFNFLCKVDGISRYENQA